MCLLTVQVAQREANISLREAQSDALVFELLGELFQLLGGKILLNVTDIQILGYTNYRFPRRSWTQS